METPEHQEGQGEDAPDTNIERVEGDVTVENGDAEQQDQQDNE